MKIDLENSTPSSELGSVQLERLCGQLRLRHLEPNGMHNLGERMLLALHMPVGPEAALLVGLQRQPVASADKAMAGAGYLQQARSHPAIVVRDLVHDVLQEEQDQAGRRRMDDSRRRKLVDRRECSVLRGAAIGLDDPDRADVDITRQHRDAAVLRPGERKQAMDEPEPLQAVWMAA